MGDKQGNKNYSSGCLRFHWVFFMRLIEHGTQIGTQINHCQIKKKCEHQIHALLHIQFD